VIKLNGSGGTSFLADFDNDGDKDLLSGMWDGKFYYFRNDGSNSKPVFNPISTSFSNLTVNSYSSPIFADLDEDGDLDIVSGSLYGQINYYVNNDGSFTADSSIFGFIDVGWMSVPALADLDGDGDLDLLVSSETGSDYRFYENEGNNVFVENSTMFSNVTFPNYSRSTLADVDNDGDIDLIIGRSNGLITYYRNDGTVNAPLWVNANNVFEGIKVKQNAHAGFADLDGDGRPDMVLAEYDGNFTYFKNLFAISSSENGNEIVIEDFQLFQNYPNPFNPTTLISWQSSVGGMQSLKIYDVLGNQVTTLVNEFRPAGMYEVEFDASRFSSGVYFYKVVINGIEASTSFSKIRKMIFIK
jgi:hypothetical protein